MSIKQKACPDHCDEKLCGLKNSINGEINAKCEKCLDPYFLKDNKCLSKFLIHNSTALNLLIT